jgi:hypothetical protein
MPDTGIHQHKAGLTAGSNYVVRAVISISPDSNALPFVRIYDETNGATIVDFYGPKYTGVHDGAANAAVLTDTTARWDANLVGAKLYNITDGSSTTITAQTRTTLTGVLAGGTDNDWDVGDVYRIVWTSDGYSRHPWVESHLVTLPALCTEISGHLLNAAATGVVYAHEFSILPSLWLDGGMELGTAVTDVGTPGTSAQSNTVAHSGTYSWKVITDAIDEGISRVIAVTSGVYYHVSAWVYAATANTVDMQVAGGVLQTGSTTPRVTTANDVWQRLCGVVRATSANLTVSFLSNAAVQTFYVDDVAVVAQTAVTLTATPASAANSIESNGLRVDGYDTLTQPIPAGKLKASSGYILGPKLVMRHAPADLVKFGNAAGYFLHLVGAGTNYIIVAGTAANSVYFVFDDSSGNHHTIWNCTGAWVVGDTLQFAVRYTGSYMQLICYVNGAGGVKATLTEPPAFTAILTTAYWLTHETGQFQGDAVILE